MVNGKLIVLCGPTAAGKTGLGIQLARYLGVPVLSADSRQVYREFDIGTAKPTPQEREQAEHRLIDVASPTETFNVARYRALALAEIEKLHAARQPALLVGGSGLYLRAVAGGWQPPAVPPDLELRSQLAIQPLARLFEQLQRLDPETARRLHSNDRVRIERALEVCLASGRPMSTQQQPIHPGFEVLTVGIGSDRAALLERIERRTHQMIERGWLIEVKKLRAKYGLDLPLLRTLGYAELGAYLAGEIDQDQAIRQIVVHTRQFAKRQMTWFRSQSKIHWLDSLEESAQADLWSRLQEQVDRFLKS